METLTVGILSTPLAAALGLVVPVQAQFIAKQSFEGKPPALFFSL
jgi:hypothetical protein